MWLNAELKDISEIEKPGNLKILNLPKTKKPIETGKLKITKNKIELIKGECPVIIDTMVGIDSKVEFTFFLLNKYICVLINKGKIYVKQDGVIYEIDSKDNQTKVYKGNPEKINWCNLEDFKDYSEFWARIHYNILDKAEMKAYSENLIYNVESEYSYSNSKLFKIKMLDISEKMGGTFKFNMYEKQEVEPMDINIKSKSLYEEKEHYKHNGYKKNVFSYEDNKDDEDLRDLDDLGDSPLNLHEVNLKDEYEED